MTAIPLFVSFDYENDVDLYRLLIGQSKNPDTPFTVADWSVKNESPEWVDDARRRIGRVDQVCVLCGHYTGSATGIDIEIELARELEKPYFLLAGRADGKYARPRGALRSDKVYSWTWDNLKSLIAGSR